MARTPVLADPDRYPSGRLRVPRGVREGGPAWQQVHTQLALEALRLFLQDRLGRHELPAALEFRAALPRTAVGKLLLGSVAQELLMTVSCPVLCVKAPGG